MAYFPNGTSFAIWQDRNCHDCLNYRDNGTGSFGCAITDAHFILDYHEGTNSSVLNMLIPEDGLNQHLCAMRVTAELAKGAEHAANYQLDLLRYEKAMAEMHAVSS